MLIKNEKPLAAISYDTLTFNVLKKLILAESNIELARVDPTEFLQNPTTTYQYINLVVKDFEQRKKVSNILDSCALDRFTYIAEDSISTQFKSTDIKIGAGCMVFPSVWAYNAEIGNDVIIHSGVRLAENTKIGNGSFLSGSITIAGSCTIGSWCFIGNNLFFIDGISICNDVKLLPGTNLRKSISKPGTYYNPNTYRTEEIFV